MTGDKLYEIKFDHNFTSLGTGEGAWGCAKGQPVNFHAIHISIYCVEGEWWGSITLYHNNLLGLAYSDPGVKCDVQEEFMIALANFSDVIDPNSITGSEQGRQESYYFDCDVNCTPDINKQKLSDLGFNSVDL